MSRAVFFDRDGVIIEPEIINRKPYPVNNIAQVHIYSGTRDLMAILMKMGYLVFVVTNQPDIARGKQSADVVNEINQFLLDNLPIDEIFMCSHSDEDNCSCRKPKPGLLLLAKEKYDIDFSKSYLVGDRWKDIDAGYAVGCTTILVDRNYDEKWSFNTDFVIRDIEEVKEIINAN